MEGGDTRSPVCTPPLLCPPLPVHEPPTRLRAFAEDVLCVHTAEACALCGDPLRGSKEQRIQHAVQCLEATGGGDGGGGDVPCPQLPLSPLVCGLCGKDITRYNAVRRQQHINRCCDEQQQKDDNLEGGLHAVRFICFICGKNLSTSRVPGRVAHLKYCARMNSVPVSTVSDLVANGIPPPQRLQRPQRKPVPSSSRIKHSRSDEQADLKREEQQMALAIAASLREKNVPPSESPLQLARRYLPGLEGPDLDVQCTPAFSTSHLSRHSTREAPSEAQKELWGLAGVEANSLSPSAFQTGLLPLSGLQDAPIDLDTEDTEDDDPVPGPLTQVSPRECGGMAALLEAVENEEKEREDDSGDLTTGSNTPPPLSPQMPYPPGFLDKLHDVVRRHQKMCQRKREEMERGIEELRAAYTREIEVLTTRGESTLRDVCRKYGVSTLPKGVWPPRTDPEAGEEPTRESEPEPDQRQVAAANWGAGAERTPRSRLLDARITRHIRYCSPLYQSMLLFDRIDVCALQTELRDRRIRCSQHFLCDYLDRQGVVYVQKNKRPRQWRS